MNLRKRLVVGEGRQGWKETRVWKDNHNTLYTHKKLSKSKINQ